jgi:hypothetical protein
MQLTFTDDRPAPKKGVWFAYYGLDPSNNRPAHSDGTGKLVPNIPSVKATNALAIKVEPGRSYSFPMLNAARLYISVGDPILFAVGNAGHPHPPMAADPNDPNYKTPWDFFELTYIPLDGTAGLFNFNLSTVQSANIPLAFHVAGDDPSTRKPVSYTRGWLPGGHTAFLGALRANTDFDKLILPGTNRVLAPGTAITAYEQRVILKPRFDEDYLAAYIEKVWAKFTSTDLTFVGDPPPKSNTFVVWTGRVANGQFTFTTKAPLDLVPIVLDKPTTADLFENNFLFCASGKGTPGSLQENYALQLFGTLCAAFNRSMMLTTTTLANSSDCEWCKATKSFYQDPTTNHYSKQVHANTIEGLAYAFQSDDHCDVSSFVSVVNPTGLTVEFVAGGS